MGAEAYHGGMPHLGILLFAAITVSPAGASMPPRDSRVFSAAGGTAPYTFAFVSNASGATLTGATYTAGPTGDVQDVLRVTDATGEARSVSVLVGPGVKVAPSGVQLPPHGSYTFAATGGNGSYLWTIDGAGTIEGSGNYRAGPSGGATVHATDTLGNTASATVTIGPTVAIAPADTTVNAGNSVWFAATGGSGAYTFTLDPAASGGTIDPVSGVYRAGPISGVDDIVVLKDDLGNTTTGTIHVHANPDVPDAGSTPDISPDGVPAPAGTTVVPAHSVNLAGGGMADNACDCRAVGGDPGARQNGALAAAFAVAVGLVLFARRQRMD